jgi:hypothetical protein
MWRTWGNRNAYTVFEGSLKEIDYRRDLDIDRRTVLAYFFKK